MPGACCRCAYSAISSVASSRTDSRARAFRFCQALPPSFDSAGALASAPMYFETLPSCSCGT